MKRKNPETSLIANENKSYESKQRDYSDILRAYSSIGSGIYTDVAKFLGWDDANKVARRMKELRDMGKLENTGIKKLTPRNRPAFIHKLCDGKVKSGEEIINDWFSNYQNEKPETNPSTQLRLL